MTGRCMIVDISRCVGCQTCVVSCKAAACTGPGLFRCVMRTLSEVSEAEEKAEERRFWEPLPLRLSCLQCDPAPCMEQCPAGALRRMDGLIVLDREICRGCGKCVAACPWKLISLGRRDGAYDFPRPDRGVIEGEDVREEAQGVCSSGIKKGYVADKCSFCISPADTRQTPVCVRNCPEGAILFGDPGDPGFAELWNRARCLPGSEELNPRLRFLRSFPVSAYSPA